MLVFVSIVIIVFSGGVTPEFPKSQIYQIPNAPCTSIVHTHIFIYSYVFVLGETNIHMKGRFCVCVNPIPCVGSGSYPIARHPSHSQWSFGNGTWRPPPRRNDRTKTLTCAATSQKCMVLVFFFWGGGVRFISISTNVGQCFFSGGWWIIISLSRCFNWILIVAESFFSRCFIWPFTWEQLLKFV